ncbi:MAG: hypothetical protein IT372_36775 [Polyangiaceae bacterium]|nr:hypothetical protein [Polyangiaceae bacterium]
MSAAAPAPPPASGLRRLVAGLAAYRRDALYIAAGSAVAALAISLAVTASPARALDARAGLAARATHGLAAALPVHAGDPRPAPALAQPPAAAPPPHGPVERGQARLRGRSDRALHRAGR